MRERLFLRLQEDHTQGPESAVPANTLRALPVPAALRQHVAHSLIYRESFDEGAEVMERVLPDGAVRLVIDLTTPPSATCEATSALIIGASSSAAMVRLHGQIHGLSITLRPGAIMDLFGLPAGELADTAVPLHELLQDDAAALDERLATTPGAEARVELLWSLLQRLRRRQTTASAQVAKAITVITATAGRTRLHDVADAIGVGERRLQQLFHTHVGLSPRAVGRLSRLHHLLRALRRQPTEGWAALAVDGGFYDQSHLINEFQALCGVTPTEFINRTISGSSKTAA